MALERILDCADGGTPVIVEPYLVAGQTFVENNLLARLEALERIRTRPVRRLPLRMRAFCTFATLFLPAEVSMPRSRTSSATVREKPAILSRAAIALATWTEDATMTDFFLE